MEGVAEEERPREEVQVVRFPISGTVLWFEYPSFLKQERTFDSNQGIVEGPITRYPDAPLTWACTWDRYCLNAALDAAGLKKVSFDENFLRTKTCSLLWTKHPKSNARPFFQLQAHQKLNHLPGARSLTRKDTLAKILGAMKTDKKYGKLFNFYPTTFCLPEDRTLLRKELGLRKESEVAIPDQGMVGDRRSKGKSMKGRGSVVAVNRRQSARRNAGDRTEDREIYIQKPAASAKGMGIKLFDDKDDLFDSARRTMQKTVVQKYIADPLLLDGKKFDLRLYVLVTSFSPLRVYLFDEGLGRFCSEDYDLSLRVGGSIVGKASMRRMNSKRVLRSHLTNTHLNSKSKSYEQAEDNKSGSKWTLTAVMERIQADRGRLEANRAMDKIRDVIVKTCIACVKPSQKEDFNLGQRFEGKANRCFELFGFDILLDEKLKPWLLEVNMSPSLNCGNENERILKTKLICDTLFLVGIPYKNANKKVVQENQEENVTKTNRKSRNILKNFKNTLKKNSEKTRQSKYASWSTQKDSISRIGSQSKSLFGQSQAENVDFDGLEMDEKVAVALGCEEFVRKGHFSRIFPPPPDKAELHNLYLSFFPKDQKYINCLVKDFEPFVHNLLFENESESVQ